MTGGPAGAAAVVHSIKGCDRQKANCVREGDVERSQREERVRDWGGAFEMMAERMARAAGQSQRVWDREEDRGDRVG